MYKKRLIVLNLYVCMNVEVRCDRDLSHFKHVHIRPTYCTTIMSSLGHEAFWVHSLQGGFFSLQCNNKVHVCKSE